MKNICCTFILFFSLIVWNLNANAVVILKETFEGPGGTCALNPDLYGTGQGTWDGDGTLCYGNATSGTSQQPHNCAGGGNGLAPFTNVLGSNGGNCYAYYHYTHDEDSAILGSRTVTWPGWPSSTLHTVYYVYFSNNPGDSPPHHQKSGKWFISSAPHDTGCAGGCTDFNMANFVDPDSVPGATVGMAVTATEFTPGVTPVPSYSCEEQDVQNIYTRGVWHKVETYEKMNRGCTEGSCAGCNDQVRIYVDDVRIVNNDSWSLDGGRHNNYFSAVVLAVNASDGVGGQSLPLDWWVYYDNICAGTSYNDCTQAPFLGTKAQAEFGGGDTTPPAAPRNVRVL